MSEPNSNSLAALLEQLSASPLPSYNAPPVIEVVCGVTFQPLPALLAPHFGRLWERFRDQYPNCQEQPPLAPIVEHYDNQPSIGVEFADVPPLPRIWFLHENETRIIQVQRDRFLHNWKKVAPTDEYPRYGMVHSMFRDKLAAFREFVEAEGLGELRIIQCELTYINHLSHNQGWSTLQDIGAVLRDHVWISEGERFLPQPESINWRTTFPLPMRLGRLHASIRHGIKRDDKTPLLIMDLTARGVPESTDDQSIFLWFDLAHHWIVRGFADLTGESIQNDIWRRQ